MTPKKYISKGKLQTYLTEQVKDVKRRLQAYIEGMLKREADKWSRVKLLAKEMIEETEMESEEDELERVTFGLMEHATVQEKRMAEGLVRKDKKLLQLHNKILRHQGLPLKKADDKSHKSDKDHVDKKSATGSKHSSQGSHRRSLQSTPPLPTKFPISEDPDDDHW